MGLSLFGLPQNAPGGGGPTDQYGFPITNRPPVPSATEDQSSAATQIGQVATIPLADAFNLLAQPDQPEADPLEFTKQQHRNELNAALPTFFQQAMRDVAAQQDASQQEAAAQIAADQVQQVAEVQQVPQVASAIQQGAQRFAQAEGVQPDITAEQAVQRSAAPSSTIDRRVPAGESSAGEPAPNREIGPVGPAGPITPPEPKHATEDLWNHVRDLGHSVVNVAKDYATLPVSNVVTAAKDITHPQDIPQDTLHDLSTRVGNMVHAAHRALGLPIEAFEALPAKAFVEPVRQVARAAGYSPPVNESGTLGEALTAAGTENLGPIPGSVVGTAGHLAAGAAVWAPLGIVAKGLGMSSAVMDALFTGDALVATKPYLDAYASGEISGKQAIQGAIVSAGPQAITMGLLHGIKAVRKPEISESSFEHPGAMPEPQITRAQDLATAGPLADIQATRAEARTSTPEDLAMQAKHAGLTRTHEELAIDRGEMLSGAQRDNVTPIRPDITTPLPGTAEGTTGQRVFHGTSDVTNPTGALKEGSFVTSNPEDAMTFAKAEARLNGGNPVVHEFTAGEGALQPSTTAGLAADRGAMQVVQPDALTKVEAAPQETVAQPAAVPAAEAPTPAETQRSIVEAPRPTPAATANEPEPIAAALGIAAPASRSVQPVGQPERAAASLPPIRGGRAIMPEPPTMAAISRALQSSDKLQNVITHVPGVGSAVRVVFGSAADVSTPAARMAAAHGALIGAFENSAEVGAAHMAKQPLREVFNKPALRDVKSDPLAQQYTLTVKDRAGRTTEVPINDLLQGDLSQYKLTPAQRSAILLRRQIKTEAVGRYNRVITRLAKTGFRITGIREALHDLSGLEGEQYFPRREIGRVDANGEVKLNPHESGTYSTGAVKTSASFRGSRAGVDVYALPGTDEHIEVPNGSRVYKLDEGSLLPVSYKAADGTQYHVASRQDIARFKEENPGEDLPKAVRLDRVHTITPEIPEEGAVTPRAKPEYTTLGKDEQLYRTPDGTDMRMTKAQAREFNTKLPKSERARQVATTPYSRTYTTREMIDRGHIYEDPDVTMAGWLGEIGRRTADLDLLASTMEQNKEVFKTKAQIVGPGTKTGVSPIQPAEKFGGAEGETFNVRAFDGGKLPALKDYYGPADLISEIEHRIGVQRTKLIPLLSELGNDARGLIASGDVGHVGIQLMGAIANDIGNDVRASLRMGRLSKEPIVFTNITGKSIVKTVDSLIHGGAPVMTKVLTAPENQGLLERWGHQLNPPHQSEFSSATATGGNLLSRLPVAGGVFRRLNEGFENTLFIAQLEQARAYEQIFGKDLSMADREALGSWMRNSVGTTSSTRLGIAPLQQDIENTYLLFAARYTRSLFASVGAMSKGIVGHDLGGQQARLAIGSLLGAGAIGYIGAARALGQKPEFDPRKPGFMAIRIGDNWVGVGGGVKAMAHLIATSGDSLFTSPKDFLSPDFNGPRENPILNFWQSRLSPLTGTAIDIYRQKDFRGRPIESATDWGKLVLSRTIPFAGQGALEANGNWWTKAGMGAITGLGYRSTPLSAHQQYDLYLKSQRMANGQQRFPDGASTKQTSTNGFNEFITHDSQGSYLKGEDEQARREGTSTQRDMQKIIDQRLKEAQSAEQSYKQTGNARTFRTAMGDIRSRAAQDMKQLALDTVSTTKDKDAINSWFQTYDDARATNPDGTTNSEGIDQAQAEWKTAHPGEFERVIKPGESIGLTPTETELRQDRQTITASGWWDTDQQVWDFATKQAPPQIASSLQQYHNAAAYEQARAMEFVQQAQARGYPDPYAFANTMLAKDPAVQVFHTRRTQLRSELLQRNPGLLNLLTKWEYSGQGIPAIPKQGGVKKVPSAGKVKAVTKR